jgi:hypothetical protein
MELWSCNQAIKLLKWFQLAQTTHTHQPQQKTKTHSEKKLPGHCLSLIKIQTIKQGKGKCKKYYWKILSVFGISYKLRPVLTAEE